MKLQKQLSRKTKEKEYVKWVIVIPGETIEKLGWKDGQDLTETIKGKALLLEAKNP